jgi:Phage integrase, N-terminal SAM-like domain
VRGSVYQRCFCRDPKTRKPLGQRCPRLKAKGHAAWFFRYSAPRGPDGRRRQPEVGPFPTRKAAQEELAATLARIAGGAQVPDRALTVAAYLDNWLVAKRLELKPRTYDSYAEAVALYFRPGLGHLRLVDLRDFHLQELVQEMLRLNHPLPKGERAPELLRRLTDARADDERRLLAPGEKRRKKSTRPLTAARIARTFAVIRAALNDAVPGRIMVNPYDGVVLPKVRKIRPLAWTAQREAAFRGALDKRMRAARARGRAHHGAEPGPMGSAGPAALPGDGVAARAYGTLP